jgi:hypothetical protein
VIPLIQQNIFPGCFTRSASPLALICVAFVTMSLPEIPAVFRTLAWVASAPVGIISSCTSKVLLGPALEVVLISLPVPARVRFIQLVDTSLVLLVICSSILLTTQAAFGTQATHPLQEHFVTLPFQALLALFHFFLLGFLAHVDELYFLRLTDRLTTRVLLLSVFEPPLLRGTL